MNDIFWRIIAVLLVLLLAGILAVLIAKFGRPQNVGKKRKEGVRDPEISESDTLECFNCIIEAKSGLIELAKLPDDDPRAGENLLDSMVLHCAGAAQKIQTTLSALVHPRLSGLAVQYVNLFQDFQTMAGDWIAFQADLKEARTGRGPFVYFARLAADYVSGDPWRQNRELEERSRGLSLAESQLETRAASLWSRFHALNEVLNQRAEMLCDEYGWTFEQEEQATEGGDTGSIESKGA